MEEKSKNWIIMIITSACLISVGLFAHIFFEDINRLESVLKKQESALEKQRNDLETQRRIIDAQRSEISKLASRPVSLDTGVIQRLRVNRLLLVDEDGRVLMHLSQHNGYPSQFFYDKDGKPRIGFGFTGSDKPTIDIRDAAENVIAQIHEGANSQEPSVGLVRTSSSGANGSITMSSGPKNHRIAISGHNNRPRIALGTDAAGRSLVGLSDGTIPRIALGATASGEATISMFGADGKPDLIAANAQNGQFIFYSEKTPGARIWSGLGVLSTLKSILDIMRGK